MNARPRDTSLGAGVYFKHEDYIGFGKRLVILAVDLTVLVVVGFLLLFASVVIFAFLKSETAPLFFYIWLGFIWLYMTAIKGSRLRTLGYRAVGAKIVTLRGQRPSLLRLTLRWGVWVLGLLVMLIDLLWTTIDDESQSLRDRFAGTYVVKHKAQPVGSGEVHIARCTALGYNFAYEHVTHIYSKA